MFRTLLSRRGVSAARARANYTTAKAAGLPPRLPYPAPQPVTASGTYALLRGQSIQFDLGLAAQLPGARPAIEATGSVKASTTTTSRGPDDATMHLKITAEGLHAGDEGKVTLKYLGQEYDFVVRTAVS